MKALPCKRRGQAGFSLLETVTAASLTLLLLGLAIPAFTSASDAGDRGATHILVESETRHALFKIARELENTSTTATDPLGNPRLTVTVGADPSAIVQNGSDMGGFHGTLGTYTNGENCTDIVASTDTVGGTAQTAPNATPNEAGAKGSGARGGSMWGRKRMDDRVGTDAIGINSARPRHATIAKNSILTFQKVLNYTIDASGAPDITWTTPVTYSVNNRKLVRTQDGLEQVICPVCVGFQVQISDVGTVIITIVSQTRTHAKGQVVAEANQIEISPKN